VRTPEFVGLGLIVVGLFHVLPGLVVGEIPARWPVSPLRRDNKPQEFAITLGVFIAAIILGIGLVGASLLHRLVD
jgi:hypothetical protein